MKQGCKINLERRLTVNVPVLLASALTFSLVLLSMQAHSVAAHDEVTPTAMATKKCTLKNFSALKVGMKTQSALSGFGAPQRDVGSGIHIYEYVLADQTKIWVGCVDTIFYVDHIVNDKHTRIVGNKAPTGE